MRLQASDQHQNHNSGYRQTCQRQGPGCSELDNTTPEMGHSQHLFGKPADVDSEPGEVRLSGSVKLMPKR